MAKISMKMGKSPKTEKYKGNLNIDSNNISEAKNWNIDETIDLIVTVKVTGIRKPDKWEIEDDNATSKTIKVNTDIVSIKTKAIEK